MVDGFLKRGVPQALLAFLEPHDFPHGLLHTRWVRESHAEAESDRRAGVLSADEFINHFRQKVRSCLPLVHGVVVRVAHQVCSHATAQACGGREAAVNEVISGSYTALVDGSCQYDPDRGTEEALLYALARNLSFKLTRKCAAGRETVDVALVEPTTPDAVAHPVDAADTANAMLKVLEDPDERATFAALYKDELTPDEAAARLGVSVWTVYKRREKIASRLAAAGFDPAGRRN